MNTLPLTPIPALPLPLPLPLPLWPQLLFITIAGAGPNSYSLPSLALDLTLAPLQVAVEVLALGGGVPTSTYFGDVYALCFHVTPSVK